MDSMRSLNTSLPRTSPRRGQQPPEELLSAFKAAALSVTNLYKNAATEQARARAAGYQDALDDLLSFLDKENLGLGDGEGWRVRQWATERFDGAPSAGRESDEEEEEEEEKARHSSPDTTRKPFVPTPQQEQPEPTVSDAATTQSQPVQPLAAVPQAESFTFRSSLPFPSNHDREVDMDGTAAENTANATSAPSNGNTNSGSGSTTATTTNNNNNNSNNGSVRVEVLSRRRNHNRSTTANNRNTSLNLGSLGSGAGAKRKIPFGDFFDIGSLSFGNGNKDGSDRGGKRGRHA